MPLTHYEILGLTPTATSEDIRRAYRRQALHWHPDRNPANPKAHRRFIAIKDAYAVLSNPERRAHYDEVLRLREAAKNQPPPFQNNYPPPQPRGTSYAPPPQYRPVFRERRRTTGFSGAGIGVLVLLLFNLARSCDKEATSVEYRYLEPRSDGAWKAWADSSPSELFMRDSILHAVFDGDTALLMRNGFRYADSPATILSSDF